MKTFVKKRVENRLPAKRRKDLRKKSPIKALKRIETKEPSDHANDELSVDSQFAENDSEADTESEASTSSETTESESDEETLHVPSETLEVASDDSDFDAEEFDNESAGKVTVQLVDTWEKELNANKRSLKPVSSLVQAFHGCLVSISSETSENNAGNYKIDGSTVFNAVIRLSVTSLYPYLRKLLDLPTTSVTKAHIEKSKRWSYAKNTIRSYIVDLVKLIGAISSEDILRVLLKHLHQMIPFATCLPTISKQVLKRLISLWSSNNDDTIRVIAFLCILRYAASDLTLYLHTVLKKMYFAYVVNSKFISQNTIPTVNFMRKSLSEMFSLNEIVTYNHAFMYIRQLAIHLRSAIVQKQKDSIQAVYNWQFISSLRLWVDVLSNMQDKSQLNSLIYPVVQIVIGCIKLIPTAQYLPLRFHCIQMLIQLSKETGIFIPIIPFLLEAISIIKVSSQHKKLSMKPMDFTYILRLSKVQLQENAFKDAVVENVYDCLLEYTANESHRISFPDTVVVLQIQLKQFLKDCKNMNYTRKFKPLLEKIAEVSKLITNERGGIPLADEKAIAAWESNRKLKSNSLSKFYESWKKVHEQKILQKAVEKIEVFEHKLPTLKKVTRKAKVESIKDCTLFGSGSDSEDEVMDKLSKQLEESEEKGLTIKNAKKLKTKRKLENDESVEKNGRKVKKSKLISS